MVIPPDIIGSHPSQEHQTIIQREEREDTRFWKKLAEAAILGKPSRLIEGAKQIIYINGILLIAYFAAISLSSLKDYLVMRKPWDFLLLLIISPAFMLFIGLIFAVWALEPTSYPLTSNPRLIENSYNKECGRISFRVWIARIIPVVGFGLIVINIYAYLWLICDP
jgi:hypothetical protein